METVIEIQRRCHEERERLMEAMVKESVRHKMNNKDSVFSEHIVKLLLDRYMEVTERLVNAYEDVDGLRYEEVNALGGPGQFSEFYVRVKQLRENNRKSNFKDEVAVPLSVEIDQLVNGLVECCAAGEAGLVSFTDEESWGRCLDLTSLHQQFLQLRLSSSQPMDYLTYVQQFDRLFELMSRERKLSISAPYKRYLRQLIDYLYNFLKRVHPLMNIDAELQTALEDFERDWTAGNFPGWPPREGGALTRTGAALADLAAFSSPEELASLGLDRLKSALLALGLKCGGTLKERAERLFAAAQGQVSPQCIPRTRSSDVAKEVGKLEAQVYKLAELVSAQRACTVENVQRKQARVGIEDDEEADAENMDDLDDDIDDEAEGTIYNPKNLPLGWDGKPIPYWLYKLHGLNIYYNCEICGNYKYRGPKAFQRHFAEWRHAHGMRCLGIPNTAHFANITLIEDAVALWDRLRRKKEADHWKPEVDEEFEDSSGNVVSKKVFEDLRRQGLL